MTIHSVFEDQVSPSLFEGINARYYRAAEVARSFVPNEQFENLIVRQHTLLVGPRGSGKTTLLRMLHPECLRVWDHPKADFFRQQVEFSAAYVSTDRVWRKQAEGVSATASLEERESFFSEIIALDVMAAMVRAIEVRLTKAKGGGGWHRYVDATAQAVANLVMEIAEGWNVAPKFLDLGSLRVAIRRRRIEARDRIFGSEVPRSRNEAPAIRWDDAALLAIEAFESATGVRNELWALLFDELEIVPRAVRDSILGSTRGMDSRLLLKCSLSPWLSEHAADSDEHDATVFHDFNVLKLFYGRRTESYEFSRRLIEGRLQAAGIRHPAGMPIENAVFGASQFVGDDKQGRPKRTAAAYGDETRLGQVVKDLAETDPKFRAWLVEKDISPSELNSVKETKRSQTLRKARNIIIARLEFRRASGLLRSRKTVAMYTGGTTMLDICEGNPRLLLGLLLPLLEFYDGKHPIPKHLQAEALALISDDFYALIDAIPVSVATQSAPELGPRKLRSPYREFIERVAKFFQDSILGGDFDPQPPSTFRIPSSTSRSLKLIVGRLVNMGAIIIVPDRGIKDILIGDFDQQRLRLCHLVAAREHLPPNVDRPVSIHRILGGDNVSHVAAQPGLEIDEA